ncbi:phage tail protein [Nitrospira sp. Nam80]
MPRYRFDRLSYDINRAQRELVAYTPDGKLRHRWGARDAQGNDVSASDPAAWDPVDIAGDTGCVFLLDRRYQTIYTHTYGREALSPLIQSQDSDSRWSRITLDEHGCLLVFDSRAKGSRCYGRGGKLLGASPAQWPAPISPQEGSNQPSTQQDDPPYPTDGYWLSQPLDSGLYKCQWHRIEMMLSSMPPGTQIEVKSFAYHDIEQAPLTGSDPRWVPAYAVAAPAQPPPAERTRQRVDEFLVHGGAGQFCSLLVRLRGDGFESPVVRGLRIHYPRESYLQYLPPLYSANEPMRRFLDSFLSIFQTEWDEIDRRVDESEAYFDPDAVPEGAPMKYLASWLGLQLEGSWKPDENRKLLRTVPRIYPRRGTVSALREYLSIYLANFTGQEQDVVAQTAFPAILEGFRERQYLMLSTPGGSTLGIAKPLWSDGVVRRLQFGGFSQLGEVEVVSTGDPERDLFHYFAHRVRIYLPASWVRTAEQERLLRRAIESEMPAHVNYELCLVNPGIRVDIQSTVGLDTIVGEGPPWRLPGKPEEPASSLQPVNTLGQGTVLSRDTTPGPAVLDCTARVGDWILD